MRLLSRISRAGNALQRRKFHMLIRTGGAALLENLPPHSEVDGHDFGSGEFNIFILTHQPSESFSAAEKTIGHCHPQQILRAAYRELGRDNFVIFWPQNLQDFTVT